jgi:hypothetical protein
MMKRVVAIATCAVCALPVLAQSTILPSRSGTIFGPTGLFSVPTADVLTARKFQIGTHFGRDLSTVAVNAGIANFVEVGAAFLDRDDADNRTIASAKAQFIPTGFENLKIGVGVIDIAKAVERTGYIMVTTRARFPWRWKTRYRKSYCMPVTVRACFERRLSVVQRAFSIESGA